MKLIYFYRATGNPNSGVARKINSQVKHLSDCGLDAVIYSTNGNSNQSILDPGDPEGPPPLRPGESRNSLESDSPDANLRTVPQYNQ